MNRLNVKSFFNHRRHGRHRKNIDVQRFENDAVSIVPKSSSALS